jgi:hypothetical protein
MKVNKFNESSTINKLDRVRAHTAQEVLDDIDQEIRKSILFYTTQSEDAITRRIEVLDKEWDIERYLEANASSLAFTGLMLGSSLNKKFLFLTGGILLFLFQHAVQGWCPPVPVLRRLGIRTRREIDWEKFALKALRGDFDAISSEDNNFLHVDDIFQKVKA